MSPQQRPCDSDSPQDGFGLIEIVVSMFLLGVLAVAFLPLLVTSMQTTVRNSTIATATQLVNQQMELARAAGDTCAELTAFGNPTPALAALNDARGKTYQPARSVDPCPASYPGTTLVIVSVDIVGSGLPAVTARTLVYLRAP